MKRTQWSAALLAVLLFCAGAVAGALAHRYYSASVAPPPSPPEAYRAHYIADLKSHLDLSPQQVDQLGDILDETKSKFRAAHETCRPALSKVKEEQISQVKAILTPAQLPVYNRLLAERENHAKEMEARERQADEKQAAARKARLH